MERLGGSGATAEGAGRGPPVPDHPGQQYQPSAKPPLLHLFAHSATSRMRDDELAGRVGMPAKDLAKIAQRLVEDQIVAV